ncbi:Outer membrane protein beta-barrel domain-containing protein [Dyadobacter sp. SG02]|uniref:outer membrane beta-barrel protein n=1 Tax=Dyadobacter sp. SG02 TaxID=1855291 RepID=UPI0008D21764|nr:outer membrane beta-barrel protein [Dyadobacter sp. SG02]SEI72378.1 Outer membrane protein beta-barrel domain-containing protein [Dyadobacter sp. SG02]
MKILSILSFLLICHIGLAQRTTFSVGLNSGVSRFAGASAEKTTSSSTGGLFCNCTPSAAGYLGNVPTTTYGASLTVQHEYKNHFLLALEAGYENLRTRINVENFQVDDMIFKTENAYNITRNHFINIFPSAGYNFPLAENLDLSLRGGADFGLGLSSSSRLVVREVFEDDHYTDRDGLTPGLDFRPRIEAKISGKRLGLTVNYAHGVTNWLNGWDGGVNQLYMRVWRVGVQYRIF